MRAVIQRVESASVVIWNKETHSIGQGIVILLGVMEGDTQKDADLLAKKSLRCGFFPTTPGR